MEIGITGTAFFISRERQEQIAQGGATFPTLNSNVATCHGIRTGLFLYLPTILENRTEYRLHTIF